MEIIQTILEAKPTRQPPNLQLGSIIMLATRRRRLTRANTSTRVSLVPTAVLRATNAKLWLDLKMASNPRAFFKKGRIFRTLWYEPTIASEEGSTDLATFAVVKPHPAFAVCLRISTYSGQATTNLGANVRDHVAVVPLGAMLTTRPQNEHMEKDLIEVKVENQGISIDPTSRINFAKPYTVEHNVKILNVGRVVGASVGLLDRYFAESLGHTKS